MIHITIFAGPFTTANMDQPQWEEVERFLWVSGVLSNARNLLAVTTTSGLGVSVNTGDAIIDGFRFYADATTALTAGAADPSNPRIDRVIIRIDGTAHTGTLVIKAGTPAGSPVPPSLTQTVPAGTYEFSLAQIRINAGSTTINQLTDERTFAGPNIGTGFITTAMLADLSVTQVKHANASVGTAQLIDANVTTAKILDANVTLAKLASNSVDSSKIVDASIGTGDIANAAITTALIADANVTLAKLASSSVDSSKIVDGSIATADFNAAATAPHATDLGGLLTVADSGVDIRVKSAINTRGIQLQTVDGAAVATTRLTQTSTLLTVTTSASLDNGNITTDGSGNITLVSGANIGLSGTGTVTAKLAGPNGNMALFGMSRITGTGATTASHGLGTTTGFVCLITDHTSGSTMTVGYDSETTTTVGINTGASHAWTGFVARIS